jgi:hypothetical protein
MGTGALGFGDDPLLAQIEVNLKGCKEDPSHSPHLESGAVENVSVKTRGLESSRPRIVLVHVRTLEVDSLPEL